jgi:predicted alpha/beta superfamily hydrolase
MKKLLFVIFIWAFLLNNTFLQTNIPLKIQYPQVELNNTEVRELTSNASGYKYKIYIKFPRQYNESNNNNYPVFYIIDAETNFGGISYIVQRLIKDKIIPEMLVVGIAYGVDYDTFYKLRGRDLTPSDDEGFRPGGIHHPQGGALDFAKFIKNELFPFITDNYKTKNENRAVYGHSFGGLFGFYAFLNHKSLFNKYLLLSPSLWYDNKVLFKDIKNIQSIKEKIKLYVASGELEGRIDDHQVEFIKLLKSELPTNIKIKSEILENETHRTIFGRGFTNGLRFLYSN